MTHPQLYEASKLRKYSDGTVGTEYRLIQGEGNLRSFLDEHGILWLEQPIDEVAKALVEEWMAGELSMGIDKDGEMVWQQRSKKFPQSKLVELVNNSLFDKEILERLKATWAGYKDAEKQKDVPNMKKRALEIRDLQGQLGIEKAMFPELGIV